MKSRLPGTNPRCCSSLSTQLLLRAARPIASGSRTAYGRAAAQAAGGLLLGGEWAQTPSPGAAGPAAALCPQTLRSARRSRPLRPGWARERAQPRGRPAAHVLGPLAARPRRPQPGAAPAPAGPRPSASRPHLRGLAGGLGQLLGEVAQQAVGHGVLADVGMDVEHGHGGGGGWRGRRRDRRGAAGPAERSGAAVAALALLVRAGPRRP